MSLRIKELQPSDAKRIDEKTEPKFSESVLKIDYGILVVVPPDVHPFGNSWLFGRTAFHLARRFSFRGTVG